MATELGKRLEKVKERISAACKRVNRDPGEVKLVAVSKYVEAPEVLAAAEAGVSIVGENRVQELLRKYEVVGERVQWHLIGHLQRNKVKYLPGKVKLIHSLDSLELARELDKHQSGEAPWDVLVQVNVAHEETKYGVDPAALPELLTQLRELSGIRVRGLMTIAPYADDPEEVRPVFSGLRQLRDQMAEERPDVDLGELSMGMSHDFEVAVEEGATMVRIGSAIFVGNH